MKIGVASKDKTEDSEVSEVTGRAPYYLIFEDGELVKEIKNPFARGGGGAGFAVAQMLNNEGVDLAITGRTGANAERAFKARDIEIVDASNMKIKEALKKYGK